MSRSKKILLILASAFILIDVFLLLVNTRILKQSKINIYQDMADLPEAQAVLVLGAYVNPRGVMSDMLKDRAQTALEIYDSGKVKKILISGDHGRDNYDEVNTLKQFFLDNQVPVSDIFLDHAGFDTYDSFYRAKEIFQAESLIVTTQAFHLPRAVYTGNKLGIKTSGLAADKHQYVRVWLNYLREYPARIKIWFNFLFHSKPKFLGQKIPLNEGSLKSWDQQP